MLKTLVKPTFPGPRMSDVAETLNSLMILRNDMITRLKEVDQMISQLRSVQDRINSIQQTPLPRAETGYFNFTGYNLKKGSIKPSAIADRVAEILREEGRPMTRSKIAKRLVELGVPLAGRDTSKYVGTILWRHRERFVNLERLGYWLADVELPGSYYPPERR